MNAARKPENVRATPLRMALLAWSLPLTRNKARFLRDSRTESGPVA